MLLRRSVLLGLIFLIQGQVAAADLPSVSWTENFATDPVAGARFSIPPGHNAARFTYDESGQFLRVHYDTFLPTAWYLRELDSTGHLSFGSCDDFEFTVTFRIRSAGFFADPNQFAQIGWGLLNSATTGTDRSGGSAGPYAFDCVSFDYFPNVSPIFGGPTLGPTMIHSNVGQGYFSAFEFPFGAESTIDSPLGEQAPALDTTYSARVEYFGGEQIAVLSMSQGSTPQNINNDGSGGPGGPDGDFTTIQTSIFLPDPVSVNSFALTAWQDTFNTASSSVVADVDVFEITFYAPARLKGDMNRDELVNGDDIAMFVETILAAQPDFCAVNRADFDEDTLATDGDVAGFMEALIGA